MKLVLEILTGDRVGQKIVLNEGVDLSLNPSHYILETEAFQLHLLSSKPYTEVVLLMDDTDYFFHENGNQEKYHRYTLKPKSNFSHRYDALFYNYFGIATMDVRVVCNSDVRILHFSSIEVLARKLTAAQAEYMIEYIFDESEGDLSSCFSATRLGVEYVDGGEQPQRVIEKLAKSISVLEEMLPHILNKPLTRISSETRMQNGYQATEIDEQGLVWLHENLSVLSETDDFERAHLNYNNTYYIAKEVQTAITIEHTDIYENRVIHDFLAKLKRFSIDLENGLRDTSGDRRAINRDAEGYVSFFSVMASWVSKLNSVEINTVREFNMRITHLIRLFDKKVPVSTISYGPPLFTQKVKSNRFYASIFRAAIEWHKYNRIDWRSRKMLLAIKSIPILFEYYSILKVRAELKAICGVDNFLAGKGDMLTGLYRGKNISLFYEPEYWMVGHKNSYGAKYINTEIRQFHQSEAGGGFTPSSHKHRKRVPDIVIELKKSLTENVLLIFDAKYSKIETAYKNYLRECGMKYIHGIHGVDGSSPVKSMILICPSQEKSALADMNAPPYGLFGNKTVSPVIGVQGVVLSDDQTKGGSNNIGETIRRLLDLSIDTHGQSLTS
ncbi:MAG: DUF2357 domain-containing protein [Chlorobi bacterium]|nr:DUF2357 domain-containing protein [Chlorobiota bacterium]